MEDPGKFYYSFSNQQHPIFVEKNKQKIQMIFQFNFVFSELLNLFHFYQNMKLQKSLTRNEKSKTKYVYKYSQSNMKSAIMHQKKTHNENTTSMYVNINEKILPKQGTAISIKNGYKGPQSQKNTKSLLKSPFRFKQLQVKTKDKGLMHSSINPIKQFKRKSMRKAIKSDLKADDKNLKQFYEKVEYLQQQFIQKCHLEQYQNSREVIVRLLNYSVDYNLPYQFSIALKMLADLSILVDNIQEALFFYNQSRQCCILLNNIPLLIESLIGINHCCSKQGLELEGIKILKKALEYTWLYDLKECELSIYDEIGKNYYHLGEVDKAKKYHYMNNNSIYEPQNSALRMLSKQRIKKIEEINIEMRFNQVSILFLVHLKVPIRSFEQIAPPFETKADDKSVRQCFNINKKYFGTYRKVDEQMKKIMNGWFFREQIDQPNLPDFDWAAPTKNKKYNHIDFQLNQQLNKVSTQNAFLNKQKKISNKTSYQIKQSLDQQIARKIQQKPMQLDWYQKIVKQITRDHKNKLLDVRHAVRIRGFNKKIKPNLQIVKQIYNHFFHNNIIFC